MIVIVSLTRADLIHASVLTENGGEYLRATNLDAVVVCGDQLMFCITLPFPEFNFLEPSSV